MKKINAFTDSGLREQISEFVRKYDQEEASRDNRFLFNRFADQLDAELKMSIKRSHDSRSFSFVHPQKNNVSHRGQKIRGKYYSHGDVFYCEYKDMYGIPSHGLNNIFRK